MSLAHTEFRMHLYFKQLFQRSQIRPIVFINQKGPLMERPVWMPQHRAGAWTSFVRSCAIVRQALITDGITKVGTLFFPVSHEYLSTFSVQRNSVWIGKIRGTGFSDAKWLSTLFTRLTSVMLLRYKGIAAILVVISIPVLLYNHNKSTRTSSQQHHFNRYFLSHRTVPEYKLYAYVFYATTEHYLCNSIINAHRLATLNVRDTADIVVLYNSAWNNAKTARVETLFRKLKALQVQDLLTHLFLISVICSPLAFVPAHISMGIGVTILLLSYCYASTIPLRATILQCKTSHFRKSWF